MAKITIVVVNNPFDLNSRTIKQVDHVAVKTLAGYVKDITERFEGQEFAVSVNGHIIPPEQWTDTSIKDGSYLAICPIVGKGGGGKNVLGMIAGIALAVVSMGAGNMAAYGAWSGAATSAGMAGWGFGAYLAAAAVMFVGASLISSTMASPASSVDTDFTSTSTYTWSKSQPLTGQGYPLGITYGTVSPTPIVLAQHVSSDGDKQYLNMLLCVGEGPLDAIEDIRINDNPVANYDGVTVETRLGTNDQLAIAGFNDEFVDQALSYELTTSNGWATQLADGSSAQGLEIEFNFSNGLYHLANDGSLENASVTLQAQYRKAGAATWTDWGTWTVTAAQSSAVIRTFRVDGLEEGQYEVRVQCVSKSGESSRYATRVYWTQLSQILKEEFSRPGKALIALKALATDQLSGSMPTITCKTTKSNVWVWDPTTSAYVQKPANSPAWACYDLIHRAKKLHNIQTGADDMCSFGAPYGRMTYSEFAAWAAECVAKNLTVNLFIDAASELWKALSDIEGIGRGKVVMKGTRYGAIFDSAADPVQLFTVGNIVTDSFSEEFLALKDRANAIEITFTNAAKNFQRDTITVYADDYNESDRVASPTQITLNGITSLDQAYREGKYRLRLNKYLTRTVSFEASVDAIACQVGDVILVQHDVTQWGFGGRIVSASRINGVDTLVLDREVDIVAGKTYSIMVRNSQTDEIVQRTITTSVETTSTDTVKVATQFPELPVEFDVYTFGEIDVEAKPFRVVTITRSSDMDRKITALEYVEAVYTEATDIPTIEYSALDPSIDVMALSLGQETYRQKDGTIVSNVYASWKIPRGKQAAGYDVSISTDGSSYIPYATGYDQQSIIIRNVHAPVTYWVNVAAKNDAGLAGESITSSIYVTGKDEAPPDVTNLVATVDPSDRTKAVLTWDAVDAVDLSGYKLTIDGQTIDVSSNTIIVTSANAGPTALIVAVDNSGNPSTTASSVVVPIVPKPSNVTGLTIGQEITDRSLLNVSWSAVSDSDLAMYEIRSGSTWDSGTAIEKTKSTRFSYRVPSSGYYKLWIAAVNNAGKYSAAPASAGLQVTCEPSRPTNLSCSQDPRNKANAVLTWTAPSGLDISGYDITKNGSVIAFSKETTYTTAITASGAYSFGVRAKSSGGYYSDYVSISNTITIEPLSVTGFTASQLIDNHSKVRLSWDASAAGDLSHYEIREGSTWDSGSVVASHAVGTFYDVTINTERTYTWWIKAVSVGGFSSISPASFSSLFSMNPTNPTGLAASTDADDRTEAVISWVGISDADLLEYEVRYGGTTWETATVIAITRETRVRWNPPTSNGYTIRLKARNVAKFESDELTASYTALIEPSNVTNFVASQNGDNILLVWDKVDDADVTGYEIREGSTYDNGQLIATGVTGTQHQFAVDTELTHRYHVKAINRAGKYSQQSASASVTVSNLTPRNIIFSADEISLQTGTKTNTEFGQSLITFATLGGTFADYPSTKFSDIGGETVLKLLSTNIVSDYHFNGAIDTTKWQVYNGGTNGITKNASGNLLLTYSATIYSGLKYILGTTLERGCTYVCEFKWRSNKTGTDSGFLASGGQWGGATPSNYLISNTAGAWQTDTKEFTVSATGTDPAMFLLGYGAKVSGDWIELEYLKIYKKSGLYATSGTYVSAVKDMGQIITANLSCEWQPSVLFTAGTSAVLEYRISKDNVTWDAWKTFVPIMSTFRYVQIRVTLTTGDTSKTPEVNRLILKVDVPDTDKVGSATIAAGGTTVSYGYTYWDLPFVTATAIGAGLRAEVTAITETGFTVKVVNALTGADVGGSITWHSKGY